MKYVHEILYREDKNKSQWRSKNLVRGRKDNFLVEKFEQVFTACCQTSLLKVFFSSSSQAHLLYLFTTPSFKLKALILLQYLIIIGVRIIIVYCRYLIEIEEKELNCSKVIAQISHVLNVFFYRLISSGDSFPRMEQKSQVLKSACDVNS